METTTTAALPPPQPISTTAPASDSFPQMPVAKMRLMCSYGGQIVPRPHDKCLSYAGGDTRIVAVDRRGLTLPSFSAHLAAALRLHHPFSLKYQLPGHDLDSLVSVATDEDMDNMLDEYDRVTSSPTPSRLRLFLFPAAKSTDSPILGDLESESSWFLDALRSTKLGSPGKDEFADSDLSADFLQGHAQTEKLLHHHQQRGDCMGSGRSAAESIVLETTSSFGSTSSSVSMSNLPPIRAHVEDTPMVPSHGSTESDKSILLDVSPTQAGNFSDTSENKVTPNYVNTPNNIIPYNSSGLSVKESIQVPEYSLAPQLPQQQQQQELQYVPTGSHYMQHYPSAPAPVSPYYSMYHPQMHQHQHQHQPCSYQPRQPYPIYIMPVGQTQAYNLPLHTNLVGATPIPSSQIPMYPTTSVSPAPVAFNEVGTAQPMPVLASKVCLPAPEPSTISYVPSEQNQHHFMASPSLKHPSPSPSPSPVTMSNYSNELDDDSALAQIYKSQPPAPVLAPQHQTMATVNTEMLSDALTQLHTDNIKQQRALQP